MVEHHDRLVEHVRAAKPAQQPSAEDWVESERGQHVFERVLVNAEHESQGRSRRSRAHGPSGQRGWARPYRIVVAALLLVIIAGGLSLWLLLRGPGADRDNIAQGTTSITVPAAEVTKLSAVVHIMQLVMVVTSWTGESVGPVTTTEQSLLLAAQERGLIDSSDLSSGSTAPQLEGQYAVMLWTTFGSAFPATTAPTVFPLTGLNPQQAEAVEGLQRWGVLRATDGTFDPDHPLDSLRERLLLTRMEAALKGQPSD